MSLHTHYFLAVPLPESLINRFSMYIKDLQQDFGFSRWVHPEDLHITLAFLGVINDEDQKRLTNEMRKIAQNYQPFTLKLKDLGTFGNPQAPKIFWHGVENSESLSSLREQLYKACEALDFSLDQRRFHPHITLARKWKGVAFSEDNLIESQVKSESFVVSEFILYETHLNKLPKYEKKEIFPFKQE
ncbi:RNA 2',3'-cyclic phosphodiesterase [Sutcliffiella halmapala]|uniref:RNA 2',3'-cyclic phosphodiesterase n=1 Tax=Sutcliffiella halmapala TaxID=79882 RepID=UPI000995A361|nr:RNA 2',3'-cyclic phosphodiesterase [Sutcliffiella halmapala]